MLENKQQPRLEHSLVFETLSLWRNKLYFSDNYTLISFAGNHSEMHRSILEHTIHCLVKWAGDHSILLPCPPRLLHTAHANQCFLNFLKLVKCNASSGRQSYLAGKANTEGTQAGTALRNNDLLQNKDWIFQAHQLFQPRLSLWRSAIFKSISGRKVRRLWRLCGISEVSCLLPGSDNVRILLENPAGDI